MPEATAGRTMEGMLDGHPTTGGWRVLVFGAAMAACGGQEDGSIHSPASGDPNDSHYKRAGEPITFIHMVDDGNSVTAEIKLGVGDGTFVDMPAGWSFVVTMGEETKPVTSGRTLFRDFVGKTDPVRVELRRPDRATSVFEVIPPPVFEPPRVPVKSVTIGSTVSVEVGTIDLPQSAFDCREDKLCTWVMLSADASCVSWESSVHFHDEAPSAFMFPRTVELPIVASEFSEGPCSGKIELTTASYLSYPDGNIYFGRDRGASVAFIR